MCAFPVVKCSSRTSYNRINYRHLYLSRNEMKPPSSCYFVNVPTTYIKIMDMCHSVHPIYIPISILFTLRNFKIIKCKEDPDAAPIHFPVFWNYKRSHIKCVRSLWLSSVPVVRHTTV